MTVPRATYRLQFRQHLDFAGASALMPYLARLGVSHAYASPLQAARGGSTHGYDGTDFGAMEPGIGGLEGFRAFAAAMRTAGVRLLLDIVPNHMGVAPDNPWWRDVLSWGSASPYAAHFDIDWQAPRLLLPILGNTYAEVLGKGELKLSFSPETGQFSVGYYETVLPIAPRSYARILSLSDRHALQTLARRFSLSTPATATALHGALAEVERGVVDALVARVQGDQALLHSLLEAQPWQLVHWRNARERLSYRRFFEISDLIGVRVEDPRVFADVHRMVLDLVDEGAIDGLRIDHVDGLADPLDYLTQLQKAVGQAGFYIVVEKILGPGEALRQEWPIAGSTGYEFIAVLGNVLTDESKAPDLTAAYARFIGQAPDYAHMAIDIKRRMLTYNLASELDVLTQRASALAHADLATRDLGPDTLRTAIVELAGALSVYRTYIDTAGARPDDVALLSSAAARAKATRRAEDPDAIDFLLRVLTLALPSRLQPDALRFALRFQQTTGPLMAKSIEDTLFYRYNRLIALNEVGGEPEEVGTGVAGFHEAMAHRQATQPGGLSTTATHDTKRGEDARARIYAVSEMPEAWGLAVQRWNGLNRSHTSAVAGGDAPEPEMAWFFYQSLLGAWPVDLSIADTTGLEDLRQRLKAMMQKAAREAKVRTTWTAPDAAYEDGLARFVDGVLDPVHARAFLQDFMDVTRPLLVAGALNSLTQLLVKLTAPGVPDIYQGTELWDLSLVDPDNRRKVDFAQLERLAHEVPSQTAADLVAQWRSGAIKMRLMMAGLALRRGLDGWETAPYLPTYASGARAHHVVAFARVLEHATVLAVGVRLPLTLLGASEVPLVAAAQWGDTRLVPPQDLAGLPLTDAVTGESIVLPKEGMLLADILSRFPVGLFTTRLP